MESDFFVFFQLGFEHITDLNGYDHILFIVALCVLYQLPDWKKIFVLVTAFTLGHCVTLVLASLKLIEYRTDIIEFLIPVTILLTCFNNFFHYPNESKLQKQSYSFWRYPMAGAFSLIHGLGFSNYLRSLLGKDKNIISELLAFNLGLEIGQLVIVFVVLILSFLLVDILKVKRYTWILIISGFVAGVAFKLLLEKYPF